MAANTTKQDTVRFDAELETIDDTVLVRLPAAASKQLPSRGQVAVRATIAGHERRVRKIATAASVAKMISPDPADAAAKTVSPSLRVGREGVRRGGAAGSTAVLMSGLRGLVSPWR